MHRLHSNLGQNARTAAKQEEVVILKMTEQRGNVYENKGSAFPRSAKSWNLFGNTGSYESKSRNVVEKKGRVQESGFRNHKSNSRQKAVVAQVPLGACPGLPGDLRHFKGSRQKATENRKEFTLHTFHLRIARGFRPAFQ
jgi:lipopolysaccharide export LptBFGC system permease protein LptF